MKMIGARYPVPGNESSLLLFFFDLAKCGEKNSKLSQSHMLMKTWREFSGGWLFQDLTPWSGWIDKLRGAGWKYFHDQGEGTFEHVFHISSTNL